MATDNNHLDTHGHISDIERWAAEMGEGDPIKARALIVGWSAFTGNTGDQVTVQDKTWARVSPGWTRQIWFKARKAYAEFKKRPNLELNFEEAATRMPQVRDNGDDLPF